MNEALLEEAFLLQSFLWSLASGLTQCLRCWAGCLGPIGTLHAPRKHFYLRVDGARYCLSTRIVTLAPISCSADGSHHSASDSDGEGQREDSLIPSICLSPTIRFGLWPSAMGLNFCLDARPKSRPAQRLC